MERLEASRTIHRLDSFFSMNAATLTLDVRVRDRLIGCITAIRQVAPQTIIEQANTDPTGVYLVVRGQLVKRLEGEKERTFGPDAFVCIRETLHKLPLEGDVVAETETQLVVFDTAALFELAMAAPPEVAAVLDRLE
jgi:CRP-like cAMP-binding protein